MTRGMPKEPKPPKPPKPKRTEKGKLIRLTPEAWAAIGQDAVRCKRSLTKQLEAIISAYYELGSVDMSDIGPAREVASPQLAAVVKEKSKGMTNE